jgi:hypothetical protein
MVKETGFKNYKNPVFMNTEKIEKIMIPATGRKDPANED